MDWSRSATKRESWRNATLSSEKLMKNVSSNSQHMRQQVNLLVSIVWKRICDILRYSSVTIYERRGNRVQQVNPRTMMRPNRTINETNDMIPDSAIIYYSWEGKNPVSNPETILQVRISMSLQLARRFRDAKGRSWQTLLYYIAPQPSLIGGTCTSRRKDDGRFTLSRGDDNESCEHWEYTDTYTL